MLGSMHHSCQRREDFWNKHQPQSLTVALQANYRSESGYVFETHRGVRFSKTSHCSFCVVVFRHSGVWLLMWFWRRVIQTDPLLLAPVSLIKRWMAGRSGAFCSEWVRITLLTQRWRIQSSSCCRSVVRRQVLFKKCLQSHRKWQRLNWGIGVFIS